MANAALTKLSGSLLAWLEKTAQRDPKVFYWGVYVCVYVCVCRGNEDHTYIRSTIINQNIHPHKTTMYPPSIKSQTPPLPPLPPTNPQKPNTNPKQYADVVRLENYHFFVQTMGPRQQRLLGSTALLPFIDQAQVIH
jgi:hypothetical protein